MAMTLSTMLVSWLKCEKVGTQHKEPGGATPSYWGTKSAAFALDMEALSVESPAAMSRCISSGEKPRGFPR